MIGQVREETVSRPAGDRARAHPRSEDPPGERGIDIVRVYLDDIAHRSLLDREDEERLGRTVQQGIQAERRLADGSTPRRERPALARQAREGALARQEFLEANLRLVVSVAKRYRRAGIELMDLVQAGNIGLLHAVERFDWRLGNKFSTYAVWWIRQAVTRELANSARTIRLPAHLRDRVIALVRARDRLRVQIGHEPSVEELALAVGVSDERARELLALAQDTVSLSLPVGGHDEGELGDLLADDDAVDPADDAADSAERYQVQELLEHLSAREALVLRLRFGLDRGEPRSLEDIGHELGITRERVRQIERRALARLRHDEAARPFRTAS